MGRQLRGQVVSCTVTGSILLHTNTTCQFRTIKSYCFQFSKFEGNSFYFSRQAFGSALVFGGSGLGFVSKCRPKSKILKKKCCTHPQYWALRIRLRIQEAKMNEIYAGQAFKTSIFFSKKTVLLVSYRPVLCS